MIERVREIRMLSVLERIRGFNKTAGSPRVVIVNLALARVFEFEL